VVFSVSTSRMLNFFIVFFLLSRTLRSELVSYRMPSSEERDETVSPRSDGRWFIGKVYFEIRFRSSLAS
jgi:hypothetical protein